LRSAGNFSPEWGYLAPAPSMLRTVRVVLVATAVGATAGAAVVLSLVDRSVGDNDKVAVAAHAIVTSAQAAPVQESPVAKSTAVGAPLAAAASAVSEPKPNVAAVAAPVPSAASGAAMTAPAQQASSAQGPATNASATNAAPANETSAASASQPAVAALSDAPAASTSEASAATSDATAGDQSIVGPQQPAQQKKPRHHTATWNNRDFIGTALRHLFSARAGSSYYPNRGL
jgi:hypothetical protein